MPEYNSWKNQAAKASFESYIAEALQSPFSGWDFGYLVTTRRMVVFPLSWNYYNMVHSASASSNEMLDIGTGGGEFLSKLQPLPRVTIATESYPPNVPIARKRLEPLGVKVVEIEEEEQPPYNANLPFANESFDLVVNRHEAYYPPELMRILKLGGIFITQQVGNDNWRSLLQFFLGDRLPTSHWNLNSAREELKTAGFTIVQGEEEIQYYRYYDIGAIVYSLKAIPWAIPDFSVEKYRDQLWKLHLEILEKGFYDTECHRFLAIARKDPVLKA